MDLEDYHDLMMAFRGYCEEVVKDAGGAIANFEGDGGLALFCYPLAYEDAAQRAIQAAMTMRLAGQHLPRPRREPLSVRIGASTGMVIVSEIRNAQGKPEYVVSGETANRAKRLQTFAAPGSIVLSETTRRLAEGVFEFESLGNVEHKGGLPPEPVWAVLGERATVRRYDARRAVGESPLVSREPELETILRAWDEARGGRGRFVGIVGDPGMGKSRLVEEARRRIGQDSAVRWLEGGGLSLHYNTPFYVAAQFASGLEEIGGEKLTQAPFRGPLATTAADAMERAHGGEREGLMQRLVDGIWAAASRGAAVLVVEDLHWVDPSTLELLDRLAADIADHPLLVIYTTRRDFSDRWPIGERHVTVSLGALEAAASASLARGAARARLSLAQVQTIVSRAAGVPLYVEELARLVASQDGTRGRALPPTLTDPLVALLDVLGPAKAHAQTAAVLGHEFPAGLFAAMLEGTGADPEAALTTLQDKSIIVRREANVEVCAFRHALLRDAAYDSLLRRDRRTLHERAARNIVERYPAMAEAEPQLLAQHWMEAGHAEKALVAWETAAKMASARRALREAEHAYRQALSALAGTEAISDRDQIELRIRSAFIRVLQLTHGYSAPEVAESFGRFSELARKTGATEALSREHSAWWRSVFVGGDFKAANDLADALMRATAAHGRATWRRTLKRRVGIQHRFYTGDLAGGEADFDAWNRIRDDSHRGPGDDALSMGIGGLIAQMTGRQEIGRRRIEEALELATRREDPFGRTMALHAAACFHHFSQDAERLRQSAEQMLAEALEGGFEYAIHLATGWLALADINAGRGEDAVQKANEALRGFLDMGARVSVVFWLGVLARAQAMTGASDVALDTFADALAFNQQELVFRPEVLLQRARLLRELGRPGDAERDLREAGQIAKRMGATTFQLRALIEAARLQADAGHRAKLKRTLTAARALATPELCPADLHSLADLEAAAVELVGAAIGIRDRVAPIDWSSRALRASDAAARRQYPGPALSWPLSAG